MHDGPRQHGPVLEVRVRAPPGQRAADEPFQNKQVVPVLRHSTDVNSGTQLTVLRGHTSDKSSIEKGEPF